MIAGARRFIFRAALGNSAFTPDMLGERSRIPQGDEQKSPKHGLSPEGATRGAAGDANRRIVSGESRSDFFRGLVRDWVAPRREQVADKERVHEDQRCSICRWACARGFRYAVSRLRPIFSSHPDGRPAAGAELCQSEACSQVAAPQTEARGGHPPTGEAGGALSRPDIRARLGRRQRRGIHRPDRAALADRRSVLNAAVAPQFIQAPRNSEL
jgi:hypothetical protein